jgi:hypothetical protein
MIYKDSLVEKLREKLGIAYFNSPKTELITKCPWCEADSKKQRGHLYIDVDEPIFYCQKCEEAGIFVKLCHKIGLDVSEFLDGSVLTWKPKSQTVDLFKDDSLDLVIHQDAEVDPIPLIKLAYIDGRLDGRIHKHNAPGLIWDVIAFIEKNNVKLEDWVLEKVKGMNDTFIGFLTNKGSCIIMRNCDNTSSFRYFKLALDNTNRFFKDFYGFRVAENSVDANKIVLTEGPFDLLTAIGSERFDTLRQQSIYWAASLGKNKYVSTLISVLNECKLLRANVVVLADRDTNEEFFRKTLRYLPFIENLDICWNKFGKDFGDLPIDPLIVPITRKGLSYDKSFTQNSQVISPNEAQRQLYRS